MEKVYVIIYAHYYDFQVYTECRVCDTMEKAKERLKKYARDIFDECAIFDESEDADNFEDWYSSHSHADGLYYDNDESCEYWRVSVEERGVNEN